MDKQYSDKNFTLYDNTNNIASMQLMIDKWYTKEDREQVNITLNNLLLPKPYHLPSTVITHKKTLNF